MLLSAADTQNAAARQRRRMPAFALVMFQILVLSSVRLFRSARKEMIRAVPVSCRKRIVTHLALSAFREEALGRDTYKRAGVGFEGRVCYIQVERSRFCGSNQSRPPRRAEGFGIANLVRQNRHPLDVVSCCLLNSVDVTPDRSPCAGSLMPDRMGPKF